MNTIVNFQIAKLLKELGYANLSEKSYTLYGSLSNFTNRCNNATEDDRVEAPTIAEVTMWLWVKYGAWIEVYYDHSRKEFYTVLDGEEYMFHSPAEAYSKAIEFIIQKLAY